MSSTKPQLSLVIPAYNEVQRIGAMMTNLLFSLDTHSDQRYEMFIVMDGCTDGTFEVVKRITKNNPRITTLVFPNRLGKGGALIEALKYTSSDLIAFIDADGSVSPRELIKLINLTQQYDLVIGSRYQESSVITQRPIIRTIFSRTFNISTKLLFWSIGGINDTQCGVKVFKRSLLKKIEKDFFITDFAFDINLIYSSFRNSFKVKEIGIFWVEKSGSKLSNGLTKQPFVMAFSLLRLRLYYSVLRKVLTTKEFTRIARILYLWAQS